MASVSYRLVPNVPPPDTSESISVTRAIDLVSNIDFQNRSFQRWHIQWQLGDVKMNDQLENARADGHCPPKDAMLMETNTFSHNFTTMYKSEQKVVGYDWALRIDSKSCSNRVAVQLRSVRRTAAPLELPVMYRIGFLNRTPNPTDAVNLYWSAKFHVFQPDQMAAWVQFRTLDIAKLLVAGQISLILWISIPNQVIFNPERTRQISRKKPYEHPMLAKFKNIFEKVVIPNAAEQLDGDDDDDEDAPITGSDIKLIVTNRNTNTVRSFNCHKFVLVYQSRYFRQLLTRRKRSKSTPSASRIHLLPVIREEENQYGPEDELQITDVDGSVMEHVLRYMYTGNAPRFVATSHSTILALVRIAQKFELPELVKYLEWMLMAKYDLDSQRTQQMKLADEFGLAQLRTVCVEQLADFVINKAVNLSPPRAMQDLADDTRSTIVHCAGYFMFQGDSMVMISHASNTQGLPF